MALGKEVRLYRAARQDAVDASQHVRSSTASRKLRAIAEAARALQRALDGARRTNERLAESINESLQARTVPKDEIEADAWLAAREAERRETPIDYRLLRVLALGRPGVDLAGIRSILKALEELCGDLALSFAKGSRRGPQKDNNRLAFVTRIARVLRHGGHRLSTTPKSDTSKNGGLFYRVAKILLEQTDQSRPNQPLLAAALARSRQGSFNVYNAPVSGDSRRHRRVLAELLAPSGDADSQSKKE